MMNKAVLITAAAALAEQAMAFNPHRHLHQAEKKNAEIDIVTVWHTVVVTAGQEPPVAAPTEVVNNNVPTIHSTTVVVAPTVSDAPVVAAFSAPAKTTLAKVTKPKSTSAAAPAATDSFSTESIAFSKRGMAYNDANLANTFGRSCTKCGWAYNWDSASYGLDSKYSFVPMLWDDTPNHTNQWKTNVEAAISKGSKAILSFNEPDNGGQAHMTPAAAAASHNKWLNPYSGRVQIGAPAITNSGNAGEGIQWLKNFFTACNSVSGGCKVDFCPVHWYSGAEWSETLFDHLKNAHDACGGRPIWLTEFAPIGSNDQINSFMTTYLTRLDNLSYLDAYSYFMVSADRLMSGTSSLSSYGKLYATL
ncbi:Fc.00g017950.m01.CDS01 [Cosmosporella sp. VM-42]